MAQIELIDGKLGYEGQVVLEHINFHVDKGDYLCVVGENGAGKSTLVRTLLGLIPPLGGIVRLGDGLRQRDIGYLPQQSQIQRDFPASVSEVVLSGCLNALGHRPFYGQNEKRRAQAIMEKLAITPLARKSYRDLSGGQQQRVLLARALCAAEALLVLDEPAAGLDPLVSKELYHLIDRLNQEGVTIIMVTHDLEATIRSASHVLHISSSSAYFSDRDGWMQSEQGRRFLGTSEEKADA